MDSFRLSVMRHMQENIDGNILTEAVVETAPQNGLAGYH